nr:MAG TPA: hypothetical protein [Bacteriophage sp.]DAZ07648.1 MAG TPA: hypothetical protein [Caudoviricetes sp.]
MRACCGAPSFLRAFRKLGNLTALIRWRHIPRHERSPHGH